MSSSIGATPGAQIFHVEKLTHLSCTLKLINHRLILAFGKKFGRLTVLEDSGKRNHKGEIIWKCICSCGSITNVKSSHLKSGHTKSCGCFRKENFEFKHGDARKRKRSRLYRIWLNMKNRCLNPKGNIYRYYGKRNVLVYGRDINIFS